MDMSTRPVVSKLGQHEHSEALVNRLDTAVHRCSSKYMLLKISQHSYEIICVGVFS